MSPVFTSVSPTVVFQGVPYIMTTHFVGIWVYLLYHHTVDSLWVNRTQLLMIVIIIQSSPPRAPLRLWSASLSRAQPVNYSWNWFFSLGWLARLLSQPIVSAIDMPIQQHLLQTEVGYFVRSVFCHRWQFKFWQINPFWYEMSDSVKIRLGVPSHRIWRPNDTTSNCGGGATLVESLTHFLVSFIF